MSLSNFDPNPGPGKRTKILMTVLAILVFTSPITIPVYNFLTAKRSTFYLLENFNTGKSNLVEVTNSSQRVRKLTLALKIIDENPGTDFYDMNTANRITSYYKFGQVDDLLFSIFPLQVNPQQVMVAKNCLVALQTLVANNAANGNPNLEIFKNVRYDFVVNLANGKINERLKLANQPEFCPEIQ